MGSPIIWAGSNAKNLKPNLEFAESVVKTGSFALANNQAAAADVTGLTFSGTRGGSVSLTVFIDATSDLAESFDILVIQKAASWEISVSSMGDSSGVEFSITAGGQIQYTSTNISGFSSSVSKWNATTLDA